MPRLEAPVEETDALARMTAQTAALRQKVACLARSVADTEERLASTYDMMARSRRPYDAARLRGKAHCARLYAAEEREKAAEYDQPAQARPRC